MTALTDQQRDGALALLKALHETVCDAGPQGAPAGPMYAACMGHGISLAVFEAAMGCLVRSGMIRRKGNVYFAVNK